MKDANVPSTSVVTPRPLARTATLAVVGGPMVGVIVGVSFALMRSIPEQLLAPDYLDVTGSIGWIVMTAMVGAFVGAFFGLVTGLITGAVLGLAWAVRAPQWAVLVLVLGGLTECGVSTGVLASALGVDAQAMGIAVLSSAQGVAGVILIVWVAGLRPHDLYDVLAARERERRRASLAG